MSFSILMLLLKKKRIGKLHRERQNIADSKKPNEVTQQRKGKETVINEAKKKLKENVIQKNCKWIYDADLLFNVVNYKSLRPTIEAIGQYDLSMKPPSYYEVRVKYLKKELKYTNNILKACEEDQTNNEWLLVKLNLSDEDDEEENARVHQDDDLSWGDIARASRVDVDVYAFRLRHSKEFKNTTSEASLSKATKRVSTSSKSTAKLLRLIDEDEEEEEEEVNFNNTNEKDLDCYKLNSDRE
ncbi:UNVERIFIED_CONTAM: hypothetical protein Sradi_2094000 [Sesamum radiatum]|uniref:Uncharacterized protein n=1 Tax=Sesamum radiatum TaxID=300843 RepID=A0AAW2TJ01_SESRA